MLRLSIHSSFSPFLSLCSCSSTCRERGASQSPEQGSTQPRWRAPSAIFTLSTSFTGQNNRRILIKIPISLGWNVHLLHTPNCRGSGFCCKSLPINFYFVSWFWACSCLLQRPEAREHSLRLSGESDSTCVSVNFSSSICFGLHCSNCSSTFVSEMSIQVPACILCVQGHVVLTDFGLCKEGVEPEGTTSTFCGTPEVSEKYTVHTLQWGKDTRWLIGHAANYISYMIR